MPTITVPILPLMLALAGISLTLGVSVGLLLAGIRHSETINAGGVRKSSYFALVGSTLALSSLFTALVTNLPWSS